VKLITRVKIDDLPLCLTLLLEIPPQEPRRQGLLKCLIPILDICPIGIASIALSKESFQLGISRMPKDILLLLGCQSRRSLYLCTHLGVIWFITKVEKLQNPYKFLSLSHK
jgi:hypothetical protein